MKSLREYQLLRKPGTDGAGITWGAAYTPALHADVNGVRVLVLNIGDAEGASTFCNCSDGSGFSTAVKQFDTRFIDPAALPLIDEPPR